MYCRICGEPAKYRPAKLQSLCNPCNKETPEKVTRSEFEPVYWGEKFEEVPMHIRREFYSDYLASCETVASYKEGTFD